MIDETGYRAAIEADILQWLMLCPATNASLHSVANNTRYGYSNIRRLAAKGYVRIIPLVFTKDGKQKTTDVVAITPAGIRYLAAEAKADMKRAAVFAKTSFPWLRYIEPDNTKNIIIAPESMEKETVAGIGEAAVISELAGATIPLYLTDEGIPVTDVSTIVLGTDDILRIRHSIAIRRYSTEQLRLQELEERRKEARRRNPKINSAGTLTGLNLKAISDWQADMFEGEDEDEKKHAVSYYCLRQKLNITGGKILNEYPADRSDYIRFVHPLTIKYAALRSEESIGTHDADKGRYSGLLQSRVRTLLTYPTFRTTFSWSERIVESEEKAVAAWRASLLPEYEESKAEGTCGTLLFPSAAKFAKIWKSHKRGKRSDTNLGHQFSHLYVTEVSRAGAANLRDIMLTHTDEHYEREMRRVLDHKFSEAMGYYFERTTEPKYESAFPVKVKMDDGNWYYFFIGTWFDLKHINDILRIMDKDKTFGVGVICEPWQHEYYKRIMPDAMTYWEGKTIADLDNDIE